MDNELIQTQYGYFTLKHLPTAEELKQYYADKYYQGSMSQYEKSYSEEEIKHFQNKIASRYAVIEELLVPYSSQQLKFLDIGCGEGWALDFFKRKGWEIVGLDYSSHGCATHNPHILDCLIAGDIYDSLDLLLTEGNKYDCIWLDNVLEHVTDPKQLLLKIRDLVGSTKSVLVIDVPNDFSLLQRQLLDLQCIQRPFWIAVPDHISYFNKEGLIALCAATHWQERYIMGDYPIDWHLLNPNTNYIEDRSKGKSVHLQRVVMENLLYDISIPKTNDYYRALAELGMGRSIIGFFQLNA